VDSWIIRVILQDKYPKQINIYMKLIIGFGLLFLMSCNNIKSKKNSLNSEHNISSKTDSFNIFLNKFVLKALPISVNQQLMDNFPYESIELDTFLVNKFIEKDSVFVGDLTIYSSTKYYPLYKFKIDRLWAAIIMYSSGSGGIEDKYHLIVYDSSGTVKSNYTVGKQVGSCESLETQTFSISPNYLISGKNNYYNGNCETGKMKLIKTQFLKYQIDDDGNIRQIK
jgi:hypothetical protein